MEWILSCISIQLAIVTWMININSNKRASEHERIVSELEACATATRDLHQTLIGYFYEGRQ